MDAPREFLKRLESEFRGRYRLRWSNQRGEWLIEEKLQRGEFGSFSLDEESDVFIRMRDGYGLVQSVPVTGCHAHGVAQPYLFL